LAPAYHDEFITCKSYINRQRLYIKSLQGIYALNPPLYERYLNRILAPVSLPKKFIYFFISSNFLVKLIDAGIMRYLLPKPVRYKLYDYIINGLVNVFPDRKLT
jgi:hypothetical protein